MNYNGESEFPPNFEKVDNFEWIDLQDENIFWPLVFNSINVHTSTFRKKLLEHHGRDSTRPFPSKVIFRRKFFPRAHPTYLDRVT